MTRLALLLLCWGELVLAASTSQRSVEVEWQVEPGAVKYIVEVRYEKGKFLKTFTSSDPRLRFRAPVGKYEIRARIEIASGDIGPWSEWNALEVPPEAPIAKETPKVAEPAPAKPPQLAAIQMTDLDAQAKGEFRWEISAEVTYKLSLDYKPFLGEQWTMIQKEQVLEESKSWKVSAALPPGEYRWTLLAERPGWTSPAPVVREFVVKPSEPQLTAVDKELEAIFK